MFIITDFIETFSTSHFSLSAKAKDWQHILCITDSDWPSWLPLLNLWFTNLPNKPTILVVAKSKLHHNMFGINRMDNVTWSNQTFQAFTTPSLQPLLCVKNAIFYHGSLKNFTKLYLAWLATTPTTGPNSPLLVCVSGACRLRHLSAYVGITWTLVHHSMVGGCTSYKSWIGFSCSDL